MKSMSRKQEVKKKKRIQTWDSLKEVNPMLISSSKPLEWKHSHSSNNNNKFDSTIMSLYVPLTECLPVFNYQEPSWIA